MIKATREIRGFQKKINEIIKRIKELNGLKGIKRYSLLNAIIILRI